MAKQRQIAFPVAFSPKSIDTDLGANLMWHHLDGVVLNSGLLNVWRENGAYLRYGDAKCVFLATTGLALFLSFSSFAGLIEGSPWSAVINFGSTQLGPYGAAAVICFLLATFVALLAAIPTLSKGMVRVRFLLWFDGLLAPGGLSPSPSKVIFFQDVRRFQSASDYEIALVQSMGSTELSAAEVELVAQIWVVSRIGTAKFIAAKYSIALILLGMALSFFS